MLGSEAYGLIAISSVFLNFAGIMSDFGITSIYMQRAKISEAETEEIFAIGNILSLITFILLSVSTPFIVSYYGDSRLYLIVILSGLTLLINNFGLKFRLSLEKNFDFEKLVKVEIYGAFSGFIVSILSAFIYQSIYSIVYGGLISSIVMYLGYFKYSKYLSLVSIKLKNKFWKVIFYDSIHLTAASVLNQIVISSDLIIGSKIFSPSLLGAYSVPRNINLQLHMILNPIVSRVALPLISSKQHQIENVRRIYKTILNSTASINLPIYLYLHVHSKQIVDILLGSKWDESIQIFSILALWGGLRSIYNPIGSLVVGVGRNKLLFWWSIFQIAISIPIFYYSSSFGIEGLAWGMLIFMIALYYPLWKFLVYPCCQLSILNYFKSTLIPLSISFIAILMPYQLFKFNLYGILLMFMDGLVSLIIYFLLSKKLNKEFITIVSSIIMKRK